MKRMADKVVFITGAARGQGRSHAVRFAEEGASIIAVDLCAQIDSVPYPMATEEDLAETVRLVEAAGGRIVAEKADVRDGTALDTVVRLGVDRFGRLDSVIANAGIFSMGAAHELSDETWQDVLDVNLTGAWKTCRAAIPHMIDGGRGGSIALVSSNMGLKAAFNIAHYVSSKHGLVGLTRALARELAPHMIRVNSVHPTNLDSPMIMNEYVHRAFSPDVENPGPEDSARVLGEWQELPIPWINSIDVTNALLYLCSDDARYVTGVALPVDGGSLLK